MFAPLHNKPRAFKRVVRLVSGDLTGSVVCIRSGMVVALTVSSVVLSSVCCGFGEAPAV